MTTQSTTGDASRYTHRRQMAGVGLVSFFSAGVSYVVLVLVAHALSPQENAVFLTYWALLFGTFGVLTGLFSESARAGFGSENPARAGRPRLVGSALGFGLGLCLLLGAIGALVSTLLLDRQHAWMIGIVAVAGVGFSGHLAVSGVLAGQQRWDGMALVTLWEAMTRLVSVLIVFLLVPSLTALALVSAVPALAWLVLLLRRKVRQTLHARIPTQTFGSSWPTSGTRRWPAPARRRWWSASRSSSVSPPTERRTSVLQGSCWPSALPVRR